MNIYPYQNRSLEDMDGEIWKPVKGYEEYYLVSNLGRVKKLEMLKVYMHYGKTIEILLYGKPHVMQSRILHSKLSICQPNNYNYCLSYSKIG
jgi:hypothetical protein